MPSYLGWGRKNRKNMKKTLNRILQERTDTIEFRAIRKQLMNIAQNGGNSMLRIHIEQKTLAQLHNENLTVEQVTDYGTKKWKISW